MELEYFLVCAVAAVVSGLTLFSGFGLGTVLMPVFALFFPLPVAVAATAIVHLANNLFKVFLVGRKADWAVVARFSLPAAFAALFGAALLTKLSGTTTPLWVYQFAGRAYEVTFMKLLIGFLIIFFSSFELFPRLHKMTFDPKYLFAGGLLSGFFGGLSGHQGALRSAFLIKAGLEKEAFIGSSTVSAVIVDLARLLVYGMSFYTGTFAKVAPGMSGLILAAALAAFVGSFMGARVMKKVTLRTVQIIVGALLIAVSVGMASGLL